MGEHNVIEMRANVLGSAFQKTAMEVGRIERSLRLFSRWQSLSQVESEELLHLVEILACEEQWTQIIDYASKGLLLGCTGSARFGLYRAWAEALKEDMHVEGLQWLGRHLIGRREESDGFVALALLCFVYCGRVSYARVVAGHLREQLNALTHKTLARESLAIYMCETFSHDQRSRGVKLLGDLAKASHCSYFTLRSYLHYSIENACEEDTAVAVKRMHNRYPSSAEPYWVSSLLSLYEGKWQETESAMCSVLAFHPHNAEAWLILSRCLEMKGDLVNARDVLVAHSDLFDDSDYEYNMALGCLEKSLFERSGYEPWRQMGLQHLQAALQAAACFLMPQTPVLGALEELRALPRRTSHSEYEYELSSANQGVWVLSLSETHFRRFVESRSWVLKCPPEIEKGDVVFLSCPGNSWEDPEAICAFCCVVSEPFVDTRLGDAAVLGSVVMFENSIRFGYSLVSGDRVDTEIGAVSPSLKFTKMEGKERLRLRTEAAERLRQMAEQRESEARVQEKLVRQWKEQLADLKRNLDDLAHESQRSGRRLVGGQRNARTERLLSELCQEIERANEEVERANKDVEDYQRHVKFLLPEAV